VEGAKERSTSSCDIIPFLVTMLVAIGMFKGAANHLLTKLLSPILTPLHFQLISCRLALMRR